ncbi:MAG: EamA family transporter [Gemmatimonadota bacterium]
MRRGIGFALGAAVLFGVSAPLAKGLLGNAPPQLLAGLLYLGSGIGLGIAWLVRRRRGGGAGEARLSRRDLPWLAGAIAFGGAIAPLLLMLGLMRTPASSASLLLNLEGVLTALLAWTLFREHVDRRIGVGMAAIIAGGVLLSWQGRVAWGGLIGPALIAAACLAWAIDNNLTQRISASDPLQITLLKGLIAGSVNTALSLSLGARLPAAATLAGALLLGLLAYGVSLVLYVRALRALGTARTGAYFSLAPFVGAVVGLVVWHERVTAPLVVAAGLMALGLWLHLSERHAHQHQHEALEHEHRHVHDEHHQHPHEPGDAAGEPHTHRHRHAPLVHVHPHFPDIHHRHGHSDAGR